MTKTIHAAESPEFLSRLYDGELGAEERAAFEAHRSACDECRRTADAFAATLAAFRSSPTAPPAADLSARILRKIRAQSPSRRPFGVMFGIDIRWAGVFVAALLVVLMSAPLLLRRQAPAPAAPSAISAHILDTTTATDRAQEPPGNAAPVPSGRLAELPAPPAPSAKDAPADDEKQRFSSPSLEAKAAAPGLRRQAASLEPSGGEAGGANAVDSAASPPHLSVRTADGQGAPPALASQPPDQRLTALRGREFILIVDARGRVREVLPQESDGSLSKREPATAQAGQVTGAMDALRALRFAPGDRPRRLLVRVE